MTANGEVARRHVHRLAILTGAHMSDWKSVLSRAPGTNCPFAATSQDVPWPLEARGFIYAKNLASGTTFTKMHNVIK